MEKQAEMDFGMLGFSDLKQLFAKYNVNQLFIKYLSENDNSKNQVYLGGNLDAANMFPLRNITVHKGTSKKPNANKKGKGSIIKGTLVFHWLSDNGEIHHAPHSQIILYPQYKEARFSGFLKDCSHAPRDLMAPRIPGRIMILGVSDKYGVVGYVTTAKTNLAKDIKSIGLTKQSGVFYKLALKKSKVITNTQAELLKDLRRLHKAQWINAERMLADRTIVKYESNNSGGYTLECFFNIPSNSVSAPDYLGWELKQFKVNNLDKPGKKAITLMDLGPSGEGSYYKKHGQKAFMMKYGKANTKGIKDRLDFTGSHYYGIQNNTGLTLTLLGFDPVNSKITDINKGVALIDSKGAVAAMWDYSQIFQRWNKKHANAAYIPSTFRKTTCKQHKYSALISLGSGTDPIMFLKAIVNGHVYFDPGINMKNISTPNSKVHYRGPFRIPYTELKHLYKEYKTIRLD